MPVGGSVAMSVQLAKSNWTDTAAFPCPPSKWAPQDAASCDYWFHGYQTEEGDPTAPLVGGKPLRVGPR